MLVGLGTEFDLLDSDGDLGLSCGCVLLGLFVLHLPVVAELAHRRAAVGGHLDEVHSAIFRQGDGVVSQELTEFVADIINDEDARSANTVIATKCILIKFGSKAFTGGSPQEVSWVWGSRERDKKRGVNN
jgi:hypothetical protein